MSKPTTIEDVVEEVCSIIGKFNEDGNIDIELTVGIVNLIRTTLQSQAEEHEREKRGMAKELFKVLEYLNTERELNAEQHERMGIKLALQEFKFKVAPKYGVDTQSQTGS